MSSLFAQRAITNNKIYYFYIAARVRAVLNLIIFHLPKYFKPIFLKKACFLLICKYFFLYILRHWLIAAEEHRIVTTSLCSGTKVCRISEHFSKRYECTNHLSAGNVVHTFDTSTARINITNYILPIWDFEAYENQPVEKDANTFAENVMVNGLVNSNHLNESYYG